jgi:hypothetical protein
VRLASGAFYEAISLATFYEFVKPGNVNNLAVPQLGCGPGAEAIPPMTGSLRLGRARLIKKRGGKKEKSIAIPAITGY